MVTLCRQRPRLAQRDTEARCHALAQRNVSQKRSGKEEGGGGRREEGGWSEEEGAGRELRHSMEAASASDLSKVAETFDDFWTKVAPKLWF